LKASAKNVAKLEFFRNGTVNRLHRHDRLRSEVALLLVAMSPLKVHIKHAAKVHDVELDPDRPASVFKDAVYRVTGVPLDRMKIMIKGGILKVSKPHTHWAMADSYIWR
jgi:hypothetical protein